MAMPAYCIPALLANSSLPSMVTKRACKCTVRPISLCNAQVDLPEDPNLPGSGAAPAKHVFASAPAPGRSSGDHPSPRGRISDGVGRKASTNSDGGGARAASEQGEAGARLS